MFPSPTVRDWAGRLLAYDDAADTARRNSEPAALRVYEKLRKQLCGPVGIDGFRTLAARALMLAKSESPKLSSVQVMADGTLRGFDEGDSQLDMDQHREVGVLLIAQLLGLVLSFLGEATTLRLIADLRLQAAEAQEADTTSPGSISPGSTLSVAAGSRAPEEFESILREVDRLRCASEALEGLAGQHPDLGAGLVSVAGNIRNIAIVLDVFVLVRSKGGGSQDDIPSPQTNGYVN